MNVRCRAVALSAGALLLAGAFGIVPAAAGDDSDPNDSLTTVVTGGVAWKAPSQLLPEDAASIAADLGVSDEEAAARFSGQDEFLQALTKAIESVPERYSASAWEKGIDSEAWGLIANESV